MQAPVALKSTAAYDVFETALGWVGVLVSSRGVRRTSLPEPSREDALNALGPEAQTARQDSGSVASVREAVLRYCAGERTDLSGIELDLEGAPEFFRNAWVACRSIPAGETRTYAWLARAAGSPAAARGAGQAMARNPVPLLVPCHRVVGSDGALHGFGGSVGLPLKQRLLTIESAKGLTRD